MSLSSLNQFNPTEAKAEAQEGVEVEMETSLSLPRPRRVINNDIENDAAEAIPNNEFVTAYKRYGFTTLALLLLTLLVTAASRGVAAKNTNRVVMAEQAQAQATIVPRLNPSSKSSKAKHPYPYSTKGGKASCVSGDAGVFKVNDDDSVTVITLKEAEPGDKVKGLDADLHDAVCEVEALGYWGKGALYGNYTASHYVYDESSGDIVEHGEVGEYSFNDLFILLSTCPLVLDETEQAFTPIDSDVNFGPEQGGNVIAWSDYINVFNSMFGLVKLIGVCIMDQDGYADLEGWQEFSVVLNEGYKKCVENGGEDCIVAVTLHEEAMKFYAEPCKSSYMAVLQPLLDLRDAGETDIIQQLIAGQTGQTVT